MSWTKTGRYNYQVQMEITTDRRYRRSKRVTTAYEGTQLIAYLKKQEIILLNELEIISGKKSFLVTADFKQVFEHHKNKNKLEATTIQWYEDYLNGYIESFFKTKALVEIKKGDIEQFFNYLDKITSPRTGKKLSQKTKKHYKTIMQTLFQILVDAEIISSNPVKDIKIKVPKQSLKDKFYNPEEIKDCIEKLSKKSNTRHQLMFSLCVSYGLRPSEMYGLKWSKVNLESRKMTIDRALTYVKNKGYIEKNTKTEDVREFNLNNYIVELFKKHLDDEMKKKIKLKKNKSIKEFYVFTNFNMEHLNQGVFRKYWKNFCEKNNIRHVVPYGLRHTTATILAFNNIPIPNIAQVMGHTNLSTTEIYLHAVDEVNNKINNIMENALQI